jgi:hypothetical protein
VSLVIVTSIAAPAWSIIITVTASAWSVIIAVAAPAWSVVVTVTASVTSSVVCSAFPIATVSPGISLPITLCEYEMHEINECESMKSENAEFQKPEILVEKSSQVEKIMHFSITCSAFRCSKFFLFRIFQCASSTLALAV